MVSVQKINQENFHQVYPLLSGLNPDFTEADWNKVLDYRWHRPENYAGYSLFDKEELVGFLGLIFSQRTINQRLENFANIHSWIVKPEYRNHSISLILPVSRLRQHTLTDMSPAQRVVGILQKIGFQELDSQLKLLLPLNLFNWVTKPKNIKNIACMTDKSAIADRLVGSELKLFQDHLDYRDCQHLLIKRDNNFCYILFTKVNHARFPYCYIHHISDQGLFAQSHQLIRHKISQIAANPWIIVDSRLIKSINIPLSYNLPLIFPKLYKSPRLKPEQVDNLYSELPLLNFSLLPNNLRELKDLWQDSQYWRSLQ